MTSFLLFSGLPILSFGYLEEVLHLRLAAVFVSDCLLGMASTLNHKGFESEQYKGWYYNRTCPE
jgi:hypothetical protein